MDEPKELGTLIVVVGKARNLVNKSRFGKQDPFCTVVLNEDKQKTKAIKRGGQHPEWDQELRFTIMEDLDDVLARSESTTNSLASSTMSVNSISQTEQVGVTTAQALATKSRKGPISKKGGKSLKVACFADDAKEPELIGECVVPIDEVLKKGEIDEWYEFLYKDKYSGEIYLELTFYSNDAPPVKRNVPRPSVTSYGGVGDFGANPSSSVSHHRLSNSISTSGSVSGMSLYIPPYVKPPVAGVQTAATPIPPLASQNSFANLGLPPSHQRHQTPTPYAQNEYSSSQTLPPQPAQNLSIDALTRPLSSLSIGSTSSRPLPPASPAPQQQQQHPGHGWGHRHSVGGATEAPWGSLLPQSQPAPAPAPHPRPMSSNDVIPWDQQRIDEDRRMGGATPVPRPGTGLAYQGPPGQYTGDYRQPSPIPSSLTPGAPPPPAKQHANSFSGHTAPPPSQGFRQPSPAPDPIPHPSSAPPTSPHAGYYGVPASSFAGIAQSLNQSSAPPTSGYGQLNDQYQAPPAGYQSTPPRHDYSAQPTYGTPTRQEPYPHRSSLPDPAAHQSPPPPTPPRDNGYAQHPQQGYVPPQIQPQGGYGYPQQPPAPSQTPTPTAPGGYVPWYQQTQPAQAPQSHLPPTPQPDGYASSNGYGLPPPVPGRRPIPNPPAPPKSSVGYYPSDELYAQSQQQQQYQPQTEPSWQNPQSQTPAYAPQHSQPYEQQQQYQPPQQYAGPSHSPSPFYPSHTNNDPPSSTSPYPNQRNSIGYQSSSQAYGRSPSPAPPSHQPSLAPGHHGSRNSISYQPPYGRSPSPQPQPYYNQQPPPQSNTNPPRAVSPQPPANLYPPPGPQPTYDGSRSPSPAASNISTSRQDWRSYMRDLGQAPQQQTSTTPIRSPSPQPPPKEWYTPPPTLPSSIKPPEGWRSTLPADSPGHQWRT